jgi:hypothetical protein
MDNMDDQIDELVRPTLLSDEGVQSASTHDPIKQFLVDLKGDGRHSPTDWHPFYMFLKARKGRTLGFEEPRFTLGPPRIGAEPWRNEPARPLILAASGESAASKHARLGEQLYWAHAHGCLGEALRYLKMILPTQSWTARSSRAR